MTFMSATRVALTFLVIGIGRRARPFFGSVDRARTPLGGAGILRRAFCRAFPCSDSEAVRYVELFVHCPVRLPGELELAWEMPSVSHLLCARSL